MKLFDKGRVCVVTRGSDAGKSVVILEAIDRNFVKVSGNDVKERKINTKHLEPTATVSDKVPAAKAREKKEATKKAKK